MRTTLQIACCCVIFMSVKAYVKTRDDVRIHQVTESLANGCKKLFYHTYEKLSLVSPGELLETVNHAFYMQQCAKIVSLSNENNFITAQYYPDQQQCKIYSSPTGLNNVTSETGATTLLVAGQDQPCSDKFNPCLPTDATCKNEGIQKYRCQCEACCSIWDVPENMAGCPTIYLNFENDESSCGLTGHLPVEAQYGKMGKGLRIGLGETYMLAPFQSCAAIPLICNSNFTVAFWMKRHNNVQHDVISITNETSNGQMYAGLSFEFETFGTFFKVYDPNTNITKNQLITNRPDAGTWVQYIFTYNTVQTIGYHNGSSQTSVEQDDINQEILIPEQAVIYFGKLKSDGEVNGEFDLDEIFVFSFVLEENYLSVFQ